MLKYIIFGPKTNKLSIGQAHSTNKKKKKITSISRSSSFFYILWRFFLPIIFSYLWYTLFSQQSCCHTVRVLHQSALVSFPCHTAVLLSLSSHPIFLRRASGFIGIHCQCRQHTRVCYVLILFIIDNIDLGDCLTSRPQSCQSANSLWLQFSGVWGTFYRIRRNTILLCRSLHLLLSP